MVQGATSYELGNELKKWMDKYGECFTLTHSGYHRILEFNTERDFVLFVQTFKPNREHWWRNAKIER